MGIFQKNKETLSSPKNEANKTKRKRIVTALLAAVALVCCCIAYFYRDDLTFDSTYSIESTSEISFGQNGQTLVIDNGKKTLLVLDADGELVTRYDG